MNADQNLIASLLGEAKKPEEAAAAAAATDALYNSSTTTTTSNDDTHMADINPSYTNNVAPFSSSSSSFLPSSSLLPSTSSLSDSFLSPSTYTLPTSTIGTIPHSNSSLLLSNDETVVLPSGSINSALSKFATRSSSSTSSSVAPKHDVKRISFSIPDNPYGRNTLVVQWLDSIKYNAENMFNDLNFLSRTAALVGVEVSKSREYSLDDAKLLLDEYNKMKQLPNFIDTLDPMYMAVRIQHYLIRISPIRIILNTSDSAGDSYMSTSRQEDYDTFYSNLVNTVRINPQWCNSVMTETSGEGFLRHVALGTVKLCHELMNLSTPLFLQLEVEFQNILVKHYNESKKASPKQKESLVLEKP
jgi:hypothetical protein